MKIALIGYGKMGKAIEPIAKERGHEIVLRATCVEELDTKSVSNADVAIEFTNPESALSNIQYCFEAGTPVIVGTTGWYHNYEEVKGLLNHYNGAMLTATNFSLGVNIFLEINTRLAELMQHQKQYDVKVTETHHTEKLDAPSGTAITIGEGIIDVLSRKVKWSAELTDDTESLDIQSLREPNVPGTHQVTYQSEIDKIRIEHVAHNRKGFAIGAVIAAEFMHNKTGIYTMKDVLKLS
ncbi:MAG: 4-hydroxy-tetrahydrodipicolinate reductase [Crocinitomicaceae bacterium]|nr:4-hydroxy-tetrahydrodipicolinate reductase [Crocinitomicaceae bacterium]MBT5403706.1 4-hydroxy-tetrahydrodipicolinate reductase [Crocinitomicaceae bacterium]